MRISQVRFWIMETAYILTSDESELLLAFKRPQTLKNFHIILNKDFSNLSRALNKIASKLPVDEKQNN